MDYNIIKNEIIEFIKNDILINILDIKDNINFIIKDYKVCEKNGYEVIYHISNICEIDYIDCYILVYSRNINGKSKEYMEFIIKSIVNDKIHSITKDVKMNEDDEKTLQKILKPAIIIGFYNIGFPKNEQKYFICEEYYYQYGINYYPPCFDGLPNPCYIRYNTNYYNELLGDNINIETSHVYEYRDEKGKLHSYMYRDILLPGRIEYYNDDLTRDMDSSYINAIYVKHKQFFEHGLLSRQPVDGKQYPADIMYYHPSEVLIQLANGEQKPCCEHYKINGKYERILDENGEEQPLWYINNEENIEFIKKLLIDNHKDELIYNTLLEINYKSKIYIKKILYDPINKYFIIDEKIYPRTNEIPEYISL